jgi:hypothetical integral membrane protein (TIGR02206 family)
MDLSKLPVHSKKHLTFRYVTTITLIVTKGAWVLYKQKFPLHLCDFSLVCIALGLMWPTNRTFRSIGYYIGVPGTTIAMILPEILEAGHIQSIAIVRYFITHYAILFGGLYLTFGRNDFPETKDMMKTFLIFLGYTVFLSAINQVYDTNYMYLNQRPTSAEFLKVIPQQLYIFLVIAFAAIVFLVMLGLRKVSRQVV